MRTRVKISLAHFSNVILLIPALFLLGCESFGTTKKVLIIQDELPQIEVLAGFLREQGGLEVTVVDQDTLPADTGQRVCSRHPGRAPAYN